MAYNKYTTEEIAFAIKCRNAGLSWQKISEKMTEAGYPKRSAANLAATINRIQKQYSLEVSEKVSDWKNDPATRKQCKYIAGLTLPNGSKSKKEQLINELVKSANKGNFTKSQAAEMIDTLENKSEVPSETVIKKERRSWTEEEDSIILEYKMNKDEFPPVGLFENRTHKAIVSRWNRALKHKVYETDNGVDLEEIVLSERENNEKIWTYDESLTLLIDWFDMSIDEVRDKYRCTYWLAAKHIEEHFDFVYPESESLIVRATEIRKELQTQILPYKKSLLQRWKDRRSRKKFERLQKKIDKTTKKLQKMGVNV